MPRKKRTYKKGEPHRDARLFVIVAEGEREDEYFRFFHTKNQRIRVEVVPREAGNSSPKFFLDRVQKFQNEGKWIPEQDDVLWFVLDVDRWPRETIDELKNFSETQQNWYIGISNPCFEVWLHLHVDMLEKEEKSCKELKTGLAYKISGGYHIRTFALRIAEAMKNAKLSDKHPTYYFPESMQTKLYILAEQMLELLGNNWK